MNSSVEPDGQLNAVEATATIGRLRIAIGFLQGIIAWLLLRLVPPSAYGPGAKFNIRDAFWSDRHPMLFAALALAAAFVPVIAIAELPRMRRRTLLMYLLLSSAAVAVLAAYDIWREPLENFWRGGTVRVWPSPGLAIGAALGLFIVNQLLEHRERGHAVFTHYAQHFEDSWMRGFQLVISVIFSLLFWAVLQLGATLFDLIRVGWFRTMIQHNWFICPALAMAFAAAIQLTDVRPTLLTGMRNVVLTLLSWLLPLVVVLSLGFLVALLFVGVQPLWQTRHAAAILFTACGLTIFLLNAAYKGGDSSVLPNIVVRIGGLAAGPVLLALALIGSYAVGLRVNQYGWTPDRVACAAVAVMAMIYSCGYLYAATRSAGWLRPLETVNVIASLALVTLLVLLLTPIADPARLSVSSQLSRLARGEVSSTKLDYRFLRFDSGVYGRRALARLTAGSNEDVRARATRVQAMTSKRFAGQADADAAMSEAPFSHANVYPTGMQLPADFGTGNVPPPDASTPACMQNGNACDIYVVAYGKDAKEAIIIRPAQGASGELFQRDAAGSWIHLGTFQHLNCPGVATALQNRATASVAPEHDDLLVAGLRLRFSPASGDIDGCAGPAPPDAAPQKHQVRDPSAPAHMGPAFGAPAGR